MSDHTAFGIVENNDSSASKHRLDPRAERTQSAVFDAIERLALTQPDDISVAQIVRESGISRSTFYAHFSGMEDLAAGYLNRAFRDIGQVGSTVGGSPLGACRSLLEHMVETVPLYVSVLGLPLRGRAIDRMVEGYAAQFAHILSQAPSRPETVDPTLFGSYLAGGTIAAVRQRRQERRPPPADLVVDEVLAFLPAWLT
ncbi:MAG: TetR/AcrR family transcriptional regulator [Mycetocola sp.]